MLCVVSLEWHYAYLCYAKLNILLTSEVRPLSAGETVATRASTPLSGPISSSDRPRGSKGPNFAYPDAILAAARDGYPALRSVRGVAGYRSRGGFS
jgi:hypothetical protein